MARSDGNNGEGKVAMSHVNIGIDSVTVDNTTDAEIRVALQSLANLVSNALRGADWILLTIDGEPVAWCGKHGLNAECDHS